MGRYIRRSTHELLDGPPKRMITLAFEEIWIFLSLNVRGSPCLNFVAGHRKILPD
jgi:hypothetical protein